MTNRIIEAKIIRNEQIADETFCLILQSNDCEIDARPGQFINVYLRDNSMLLPRPISICFSEKDRITLVYKVVGKGTKELSGYKPDGTIKISTPLGNGYDLDSVFSEITRKADGSYTIALAAGGLGVPPMVELAKTIRGVLIDRNIIENTSLEIKMIAALGFQEEVFLVEELEKFCDEIHIATDKGTAGYQGNVLDMMEAQQIKADYYFACGPKPMLKAIANLCSKLDKPLQVSLEERMGCGYGACVGCTCKTQEMENGIVKVKQKKVCKDGPVFFGNEVIWDE